MRSNASAGERRGSSDMRAPHERHGTSATAESVPRPTVRLVAPLLAPPSCPELLSPPALEQARSRSLNWGVLTRYTKDFVALVIESCPVSDHEAVLLQPG